MDWSHASPAWGQRRQVQKARRRGASTVLFNIVQFINGLLGCICELHDQIDFNCFMQEDQAMPCDLHVVPWRNGWRSKTPSFPEEQHVHERFTEGLRKEMQTIFRWSDLKVDVPMFFSVFWFHVKFQSHMVTSVSHFAGHNSTEGIEGTAGERDSPMGRGRGGLGSMAL